MAVCVCFDLFNRLNGKDVNKRVFDHLIEAGALDTLIRSSKLLVL